MVNMEKKGQVTIFIILGVLIIVLGILLYLVYPKLSANFGFDEENPSTFIQNCLEEKVQEGLDIVTLQGGSLAPTHYLMYENGKVEYLCYTGEYYQTCVMQQPMLKSHIESEIESYIEEVADSCFDDLKTSYEKKGYSISLKKGGMDVELIPEKVIVNFNTSLDLTKTESKSFDSFRVVLNNNLYELVSIANSILNWEAHYGDAETTIYMNYYHDMKVEKFKLSDGSTVYTISERDTNNKLRFASRSVAWPPGYG